MILKEAPETRRLQIRAYRKSDRDFCLSLWCDEENGKYMSDPLLKNADEKYLAFFDAMEDEPGGYYLIAELKESAAPVGTCCIFPEGGNYDIGYCIAKEHWREGLGSEMMQALIGWIEADGGRSVTAEAADRNAASVALLRKFGFREDRETKYKKRGEDTVFDAHVFKRVIDRPGPERPGDPPAAVFTAVG